MKSKYIVTNRLNHSVTAYYFQTFGCIEQDTYLEVEKNEKDQYVINIFFSEEHQNTVIISESGLNDLIEKGNNEKIHNLITILTKVKPKTYSKKFWNDLLINEI